jgi:hypothetical protein
MTSSRDGCVIGNLSSWDEIAGVHGTRCASEGQVTLGKISREWRVASFLISATVTRRSGALVAKGEPNSATIAMPGAYGKVEFCRVAGPKMAAWTSDDTPGA